MYNAFLQRTKETISALSKHIVASDRFRAAVFDDKLRCVAEAPCFDPALGSIETVPDRVEWRIIDHCAAVTRIYAIYEQFAHEMVREHLSLLQGRIPFSDLPDSIQSSYRIGIARILDKKDVPRFADLDLAQLIAGYDRALTGKEYALEARAMLMQEQNLRLSELHRFMSACGIGGVDAWVGKHSAVKDFFSRDDRLTSSVASELTELIKYRNDAAHGSIDIGDILHLNVMIEFCEFVSALCEALTEKVQLAGLRALESQKQVKALGKVNETLKEGMVAIGAMTGELKVGATVYLCGETYCLERSVTSLQVEGVSRQEVNLTVATELGMMFDAPGKKNAVILMIEPS